MVCETPGSTTRNLLAQSKFKNQKDVPPKTDTAQAVMAQVLS
jgi:hypothetical protein